MISINSLAIILVLIAPTSATKSALRVSLFRCLASVLNLVFIPYLINSSFQCKYQPRELTVCDTLKACYLVNIKTRDETLLDGYDSFTIDPTNEEGYTIRCDVNGVNELHFIKFKYNDYVMEDFSVPRYMFGDSDAGTYLNKVEYLSSCGHKTITVEGHVWDKECFTKNFYINARNPKGIYCSSAPANAPVKSTVKTPVKSPIGTLS